MIDLGIRGGWLTVNRFCNYRCKWCYATGTKFKSTDNMPLELAIKLIDLMKDLGVTSVILIGGETLFWPHLFEAATYIKSLGMTSTVVTNGWLLGFPKFRTRVERSDITSLNISLKAGNRQQHIDLTGFDGFDRVNEGLRHVSKWQHIGVEVSTVFSTEVLSNLKEVVEVAFANGAPFLNMSVCGPSFSDDGINTQYVPEPAEVIRAFEQNYEQVQALSGGRFSLEGILPACLWPDELRTLMESRDQVSYGCHFKTRSGVIFDRWGNVIPCNHLFDYHIGQYGIDFTDVNGFTQMWNKPELQAFYGNMLAYPAKRCVSCEAFDMCGGGCPLNWFVREPELLIPSGGGI